MTSNAQWFDGFDTPSATQPPTPHSHTKGGATHQPRSGKVREVYDVGDGRLVIVTTDRISAFDVVLPTPIPGKGQVLNALSNFWFARTQGIIPNHLITADDSEIAAALSGLSSDFCSPNLHCLGQKLYRDDPLAKGRTVLVKKLRMLPYEVIVRGYMFGSMYEAYKRGNMLGSPSVFAATCATSLDKNVSRRPLHEYALAEKLDEPIVTPSTKAAAGHDVNITAEEMTRQLGSELGGRVIDSALAVYKSCYDWAYQRGIIIADTKFEFGLDDDGTLTLADEVLTPDSSRFWDAAAYRVGESPASYDKQFVRDWLKANGLAGKAGVELPSEIVDKTAALYKECQRRIMG